MKPTSQLHRTILSGGIACASLLFASPAFGQYSVTILHHNDAESKLINLGAGAAAEYGGIARFGTLLDETRSFYQGLNHGVVTLSAGDSYLAGAIFQASLDSGAPGSRTFYDALGMSLLRYDAVTIGNHEFDFGPNVLAEFIGDAQTTNPTKFLSANLDFSGVPALQAHRDAGRIAPSTIVNVNTSVGVKKVGIIGATTDTLPFVSSPGAVTVTNVADAVNAQIDALKADGAHVIVLSSHLQGLSNDQSLVPLLKPGVDLIIAGGGDELLANRANPSPLTTYNNNAPGSVTDTGFVPVSGYDNPSVAPNQERYPIFSANQDSSGKTIPIVTSRDNYSYLGRITLNVAQDGTVSVDPSSNPQRVVSTAVDATHGVVPNQTLQTQVVDPVQSFISGLAQQIIGNTSVLLNRSDVRFRETNLGNLVADAFLTKAQQLATSFGTDTPQISLVNGGGIRDFIGAGSISKLDTFDVSPFGNILAVVKDVTSADFKLLLENAYSKVSDSAAEGITPAGTDGRFAQISGFA
jgi:5'-nucleotidase